MKKADKFVIERVRTYFQEHMKDYDGERALVFCGGSRRTGDSYIYLVMAKEKNGNNYACWTCWNDKTESLNFGHYNLSYRDAMCVLEEFEPILDGQMRFIVVDNNEYEEPKQFANKTQLFKFAISILEDRFDMEYGYSSPIRQVLQYVSPDMAGNILKDYNYTITSGTEQDFDRILKEFHAADYNKEEDYTT